MSSYSYGKRVDYNFNQKCPHTPLRVIIKGILDGGYSAVLHNIRGGSLYLLQSFTRGGGGVKKCTKKCYIKFEWPHRIYNIYFNIIKNLIGTKNRNKTKKFLFYLFPRIFL